MNRKEQWMNKSKQEKNKFNNGAVALFAGLLSIAVFAPCGLEAQTITLIEARTSVGNGLKTPNSVAVDISGNVYVADTGNSRVVRIALDGAQTTVGSGWTRPTGVAVDAGGSVYVSDASNGTLMQVDTHGGLSTLLSNLKQAAGVAVDQNGMVYVADTSAGRIVMRSANVLGYSTPKTFGGSWTQPTAVAADTAGNVFVAELGKVTRVATDGSKTPVGGAWL